MKISPASVFLIGMPGSGKTTIGRGLARTLALPFVDLDQQIEERCGVKIPIIFEIEGEQGFRKRESQVLEDGHAAAKYCIGHRGWRNFGRRKPTTFGSARPCGLFASLH